MKFGLTSLCCHCNYGSLFFRPRWSIQINRRHTSAGTCGLQRDFCGSHLSTGWHGSNSKPFHSAAGWLMALCYLWRLRGGTNHGGNYQCVWSSLICGRSLNMCLLVWKTAFIFVAFHKCRKGCGMQEVSSDFFQINVKLYSVQSWQERICCLGIVRNPLDIVNFETTTLKLVKNAPNIVYMLCIFKYITTVFKLNGSE